ncbi:MalY/PatB family protein [Agrilactobacillus yilanensis]|uniref:cysteine-S-conjugate beta-lyase n=1 Tax=Agrilactobacillus yilanensis TaxID=2485997 RepID=A0ABW4J8U1_9LACO|nr:MalY/PatB family protein [Agrilactobacillus yilanensis]
MVELSNTLQQFVTENLVDRKHTAALKWDALQERYGNADLLPLWVADMEFKTPKAVQDALIQRVEQGVFGYSLIPDGYFEAFAGWQAKRHHIQLEKDWLRFDHGVVNSLYAMVHWCTKPGDQVLVLQPVYYPFMSAIEDNGRQVVSVDLVNQGDRWTIDFDRLETTLAQGQIKLFLFCSPHNPVGRIWTEAELEKVLALCRQYHVQLVSDEIHQDFELNGHKFTSVLNVAKGRYQNDVVVLTAPSKTFNLASLANSHVLIPDADKRQAYDDFIKTIHATENSLLGQVAAKAAYQHGEAWFDNLLGVITYNYQSLKEAFQTNCPEITVADLQGTYLSYINLAPVVNADALEDFVQNRCGLAVDYGAWFAPKDNTYIRLNLATDPAIVKTAVQRLITELKNQTK